MDELRRDHPGLPLKVKVFGTLFLVLQIVFALNNYGPQRVPGLNLVFDGPWLAPAVVGTFGAPDGEDGGIRFEDVTEPAGLHGFERSRVNSANPNYLEVMGGGVAVADVTGNGYDDIFLTSMPSFADDGWPAQSSVLYRNDGDGTFTDITAQVGLDEIAGYPMGALFFDSNNNGLPDLYVASYQGGQFFLNEGGRFHDATEAAGLSLDGLCGPLSCFASAASAVDYDRDGNLDVFIVNNVDWDIENPAHYGERRLFPAFFAAQRSILFRNRGDGTFEEVSEAVGISNEGGKGLSAVWFDFTDNGWPDLYIANDLSRNRLYINDGNGAFREMAAGARVNEVKSSMGVTAADFDHSGHTDLVTTNLEGTGISLFRNTGNARYDYATHYSGLNPTTRSSGWGVEAVDLNHSGFPDLVMAAGPVWDVDPTDAENLFFENLGDGTFRDVTARVGSFENQSVSRGIAVLDLLNDGTPDLIINNIDGGRPQLLLNRTESGHGWLKLTLTGMTSNRDAVGARVTVTRSDGLVMAQEVRAGNSYQSTSTRALFFGLGPFEVEGVAIRWPSGLEENISGLAGNQVVSIREGEGTGIGSSDPQ